MTRFDFARNYIYLKKTPISFTGREYLRDVYNCPAKRLVIRASRQVEKSTFLTNAIVHAAVTMPSVTILFVAPRDQQASVFTKTRLMPAIQDSPVIARAPVGEAREAGYQRRAIRQRFDAARESSVPYCRRRARSQC